MLLKCAWSPDGERVTCGSADRFYACIITSVFFCVTLVFDVRIVHIWDASSCKELYYLPGHKGSVNEVLSIVFRIQFVFITKYFVAGNISP